LIFDVLGRFEALYRERKREKAALDFNDLERRAIELLERHADVRDRVRKQFRRYWWMNFRTSTSSRRS